jgi:hypothetical protein
VMKHRLIALPLLGLLALPALPAQAAVTVNQLQTLVSSTAGQPFRDRVKFELVLTAEQIVSESVGTAKHADRARLASAILNNPDGYVTSFAQAVVVQLPLASTNLVTVAGVANADVDTADATVQSDISAVFNAFLPNP